MDPEDLLREIFRHEPMAYTRRSPGAPGGLAITLPGDVLDEAERLAKLPGAKAVAGRRRRGGVLKKAVEIGLPIVAQMIEGKKAKSL